MLTSKFGQSYACTYMDKRQEDQRQLEDEKAAMESGIPELLKPMEDRPCLIIVRQFACQLVLQCFNYAVTLLALSLI